MKKNKITKHHLLLLVITTLILNSCSKDNIENRPTFPEKSGIKISEETAKIVALNFFNKIKNSQLSRANYQNSAVLTIDSIPDFNNQTAIYAVNMAPNGYVLVTSNSKNVPIAAYSDEGTFNLDENSSDGLKGWIAENIIFNDLLEEMAPIEEVDKDWYYLSEGRMPYPGNLEGNGGSPDYTVRFSHTVNQQYGPFLQTLWDQNEPFNYFTPNNSPTGCVAVAATQIMRFHEWPNNYNWSIMPNEPNIFQNDIGTLSIASLMNNFGENVGMTYSANSSGATGINARNTLVNSYGYSNSATYSSYDFNSVVQEIKTYHRPIFMDGYHSYQVNGIWFWQNTTYQNGHAWVCDGYKRQYDLYIHNENTQYEYTSAENNFEWLHMNWGWGNNSGNGWFLKITYIIIIH